MGEPRGKDEARVQTGVERSRWAQGGTGGRGAKAVRESGLTEAQRGSLEAGEVGAKTNTCRIVSVDFCCSTKNRDFLSHISQ